MGRLADVEEEAAGAAEEERNIGAGFEVSGGWLVFAVF